MLTRRQWLILNSLMDDDESIERVYWMYANGDSSIDPIDLLTDIFLLFEKRLVTIRQEAIRVFGQTFEARVIHPTTPHDIVGDLAQQFEAFRKKRDYAHHETLGTSSGAFTGGVPLGIWISITPMGQDKWNSPEHEDYRSTYQSPRVWEN